MATEPFAAHPHELQVWAVRTRPPAGRGLRAWAGYLLGLAIRAFTLRYGGRYSHLLLRLGDAIWEAAGRGIREGHAAEYRDRRFVIDVFRVPLEAEARGRVLAWVRAAVGVPYDFAQLVRIALAELGQDPDACFVPDFGDDRLICSEFVALACRQGGLDLAADTPLWRWTPDHVDDAARAGTLVPRGRLAWGASCAADQWARAPMPGSLVAPA